MRLTRLALAASLLAVVALASPPAQAGTTTPLSSIPALGAPTPLRPPESPTSVPGLVLDSKDGSRETAWHTFTAATGRGYCFQYAENGGLSWSGTKGSSSRSTSEDFDLVHFVERRRRSRSSVRVCTSILRTAPWSRRGAPAWS